jgi:putative endonuclease
VFRPGPVREAEDVFSTIDRGRHAEAMAASFLLLQGYAIAARNVRLGPLEIDLVARRGDVLAIVEVKYRRKNVLGGAGGAVGFTKVRHLETAAVRFVRARGLRGVRLRFDVVLIEPGTDENALVVRHIRNAFPATGRYAL